MLLVEKHGEDGFTAKVVYESEGVDWETKVPMSLGELKKKFLELGCHPVDISDVLGEAVKYGRGEM